MTYSRERALSDLVEELLEPDKYNSRVRPGFAQGKPLDVSININVNDISSISEVKMVGAIVCPLVFFARKILDFSPSEASNLNITLNHNQFDRLWTPDVFVRNLKAGQFHDITVPNRLIRLSPDGVILYSQRLALTLACDMVLDKYPMDSQMCKIELGSYAYTLEDLVFRWRTDVHPVELSPTISLPEYAITNVSYVVCQKAFSSTGDFPCLQAFIHLTRRLRVYILTTYLPSFLVVLLSWLSFWIDMESAPARTSLSILTVLTITTQSSGLLRSMPAGSFTKAIDVWMATCLVFVFGAFIEYSVVNTLARREKAKAMAATAAPPKPKLKAAAATDFAPSLCRCPRESFPQTNGWNDDNLTLQLSPCVCKKMERGNDCRLKDDRLEVERKKNTYWSRLSKNKAIMVEVISRVLFPLFFFIFNLVYWPFYLYSDS